MGVTALISKQMAISTKQFENLGLFHAEVLKFISKKRDIADTVICALLSGGHLLLEDVPGVGKTTFIKALAQMLDLRVSRIQFTSDLMPSDVIGIEVFDSTGNSFRFHQGPIFSNIVIADELNRASPRTQSALLEAMGEGLVTVDRESYALPKPFLVFASQNPNDNVGTYDIPESQLDRFSAKITMGYPDNEQELLIFQKAEINPLRNVAAKILDASFLTNMNEALENIHIADETVRYAKRVIDLSRSSSTIKLGISTRGGLMWLRMAKAMAILQGRVYVTPDDLQKLAKNCLSHRIVVRPGLDGGVEVEKILHSVSVT
jgi:MoxR-like ATPase